MEPVRERALNAGVVLLLIVMCVSCTKMTTASDDPIEYWIAVTGAVVDSSGTPVQPAHVSVRAAYLCSFAVREQAAQIVGNVYSADIVRTNSRQGEDCVTVTVTPESDSPYKATVSQGVRVTYAHEAYPPRDTAVVNVVMLRK